MLMDSTLLAYINTLLEHETLTALEELNRKIDQDGLYQKQFEVYVEARKRYSDWSDWCDEEYERKTTQGT